MNISDVRPPSSGAGAPPSPPGGRLVGAVRCFMWCLLTTEIPPAGAPLGAGFAVRQWLVGAREY